MVARWTSISVYTVVKSKGCGFEPHQEWDSISIYFFSSIEASGFELRIFDLIDHCDGFLSGPAISPAMLSYY